MTCVVGLVADGRVWLGADSLTGSAHSGQISQERTPKIFRRGEMLIGFTSSWRMGQLLRWKLELPPRKEEGMVKKDVHEWLATVFVDRVRECFKAGGFAHKEFEQESGGNFLVGFEGRLFEISSDYQVAEPAEGMTAVGHGEVYALGALHALTAFERLTVQMYPNQKLQHALEAAAYYSAFVRGPFTYDSL